MDDFVTSPQCEEFYTTQFSYPFFSFDFYTYEVICDGGDRLDLYRGILCEDSYSEAVKALEAIYGKTIVEIESICKVSFEEAHSIDSYLEVRA